MALLRKYNVHLECTWPVIGTLDKTNSGEAFFTIHATSFDAACIQASSLRGTMDKETRRWVIRGIEEADRQDDDE